MSTVDAIITMEVPSSSNHLDAQPPTETDSVESMDGEEVFDMTHNVDLPTRIRKPVIRRHSELPRRAADFSTLLTAQSSGDKRAVDTDSVSDSHLLTHTIPAHGTAAEVVSGTPRRKPLGSIDEKAVIPEIPQESARKPSVARESLTLFGDAEENSAASAPSAPTMTQAEITLLSKSLFAMFQTLPIYKQLMKSLDTWLNEQTKKARTSKGPMSTTWQTEFCQEVKSICSHFVEKCKTSPPYSIPPESTAELLASVKKHNTKYPSSLPMSNASRRSSSAGIARFADKLSSAAGAVHRANQHGRHRYKTVLLAERNRHLGMVAALAVGSPRPGTKAYYDHTVRLLTKAPLTTPFPRYLPDPIVSSVIERGKLMVAGDYMLTSEFIQRHSTEELTPMDFSEPSPLFAAHASLVADDALLQPGRRRRTSSDGSANGTSPAAEKHAVKLASTAMQSVPSTLNAANAAIRRAGMVGDVDNVGIDGASRGSTPSLPGESATATLTSTTRPPTIVSDALASHRPRARTTCEVLQIPVEAYEYVRNQVERHAMTMLYSFTFATAQEDVAEDLQVYERLRSLQWLSPQDLRVPEGAAQPLVLRMAVQELRQMNQFLTPEDKLNSIIAACTLMYRALTLSARKQAGDMAAAGADEFLPSLIYVALQANVPKLMSNLNYIERFRDDSQMMGRSGYCFVHLRSAVYYLMELDPTTLDLAPDKFAANCQAASRGLLKPWLESAPLRE